MIFNLAISENAINLRVVAHITPNKKFADILSISDMK